MSEQQPTNDDSFEELLQAWGTRAPGALPGDLKGRVLQRMTARPATRYRVALVVSTILLVGLGVTVFKWGKNAHQQKVAVEQIAPPAKPATQAEIQKQIAFLKTELRVAELASIIRIQEQQLQELQRDCAERRQELERAVVREQVVSEWLASLHN